MFSKGGPICILNIDIGPPFEIKDSPHLAEIHLKPTLSWLIVIRILVNGPPRTFPGVRQDVVQDFTRLANEVHFPASFPEIHRVVIFRQDPKQDTNTESAGHIKFPRSF